MFDLRKRFEDYRVVLITGFLSLLMLMAVTVSLIVFLARSLQENIEMVDSNYTVSVRILGQIETDINLLRVLLRDGLYFSELSENSPTCLEIDSLAAAIRGNMMRYLPLETLPEEVQLRGSLNKDFDSYLSSVEDVVEVMSEGNRAEAIARFQSTVLPRKRLLDNVTHILTVSNQNAAKRANEHLDSLEQRYIASAGLILILSIFVGFSIFRYVSGWIGTHIESIAAAEREKESLLEEVTLRQSRIEQLLIDITVREEDQRKRFAQELHDAIGHGLTTAIFNLNAARAEHESAPAAEGLLKHSKEPYLENATASVLEALAETKRISYELRPPLLDDFGVARALKQLAIDFEKRTRIAVQAELDMNLRRLPSQTEIALFRVTQEAFTNIEKYAVADNVLVQLIGRDDGTVALTISDNGKGFNMQRLPEGKSHLGLKNIAERIELIGGTVIIDSLPGRGTEINVELKPEGTQT